MDDGLFQASPLPDTSPAESPITVVRLFKAQSRRLTGFLAKKLRNDSDAQDASQEVFLRLWKQEQTGKLRDDATAYMYSAARSVAIDCERRRQSHGADQNVELDESQFAELPDPQVAPSDDLQHWRQGIDALVSSLEELPAKTQQIFILYHFESLTYPDIALRLGISERSVERHMARAFAHCRKAVEDYL